jgi:hypothetical protein
MPIHYQVTFPLMLAIASCAVVLSVMATRNSVEGRRSWLAPLWARKRESFTATGWRFRNWSVYCGFFFIAV